MRRRKSRGKGNGRNIQQKGKPIDSRTEHTHILAFHAARDGQRQGAGHTGKKSAMCSRTIFCLTMHTHTHTLNLTECPVGRVAQPAREMWPLFGCAAAACARRLKVYILYIGENAAKQGERTEKCVLASDGTLIRRITAMVRI